MKIEFYLHVTWGKHFKQLALLPTVFVTTNRFQKNRFSILSISFLMLDFGISYYKKL
jgi:hypothetical protein